MPKIKASIDIQAPREQVFQVFSDLPACAERIQGIDKIEMLSDRPMQVGTRWRETRTMFGKEATEDMWITEADDLKFYNTRAESHGAIYKSGIIVDEEDGKTRLTMTFEGKPVSIGAKIMTFLMGWMMNGSTRKAFEKDLENIKQSIEADS